MDPARAITPLSVAPARKHLHLAPPPVPRPAAFERRAAIAQEDFSFLSYAQAMTTERRQALADRLLAEHIYHVDYIRGTIGLLAVLPIIYGLLTWVFPDELWSGSEVYNTALSVPGAPQSWGVAFVSLGVTLLLCAFKRCYRATMAVSLLIALVLGMFMVTFGTEYYLRHNESSLPPALAWGVFSLLFLNLYRLASKMRHLDESYRDLPPDDTLDDE